MLVSKILKLYNYKNNNNNKSSATFVYTVFKGRGQSQDLMACKMQSFGMNCMACLIALLAASATAIAADTCDLEQYDTSSLNK